MGRGGSYLVNEDGVEVLIDPPTAPAPQARGPGEIDSPDDAAAPQQQAPGDAEGRGGPSAAAPLDLPPKSSRKKE
jgi:hypothetical protein